MRSDVQTGHGWAHLRAGSALGRGGVGKLGKALGTWLASALLLAACDDSAGGGWQGERAGQDGAAGQGAQGAAGMAGGGSSASGASGEAGTGSAGGSEPVETAWHVDLSFGEKGVARLPGLDREANKLDQQAQPDGKLLVVGGPKGAVVRVLPDGRLDPSFGTNGVSTPGGELFYSQSLALQADGKVLISGLDGSNPLVVPVLRLLPDGTLDPSFGQGGRAELGLLGAEHYGVVDLQLAPDGAIVGVARVTRDIGCTGALVFRLLPTGEPDRSFGVLAGSEIEGPGFSTFSSGDLDDSPGSHGCEEDYPVHLRVNPDRSFDVIGTAKNYLREPGEDFDTFWGKFKPDGLPDLAFGTAGFLFFDTATSTANQGRANGTSRVVGTRAGGFFANDASGSYHDRGDWAVVKLTPEGTFDPTFGAQGVARYAEPAPMPGDLSRLPFYGLVALPDDSVLVVGWQYVTGRPDPLNPAGQIAMIQHLMADGSRDPKFGQEGVLSFDLGLADLVTNGASLQPDGSVLLRGAAQAIEPFSFDYYAALVRLVPPVVAPASRSRASR